jgi:hypothetical protein
MPIFPSFQGQSVADRRPKTIRRSRSGHRRTSLLQPNGLVGLYLCWKAAERNRLAWIMCTFADVYIFGLPCSAVILLHSSSGKLSLLLASPLPERPLGPSPMLLLVSLGLLLLLVFEGLLTLCLPTSAGAVRPPFLSQLFLPPSLLMQSS